MRVTPAKRIPKELHDRLHGSRSSPDPRPLWTQVRRTAISSALPQTAGLMTRVGRPGRPPVTALSDRILRRLIVAVTGTWKTVRF